LLLWGGRQGGRETSFILHFFCSFNLNSYVERSIQVCKYVEYTKFELTLYPKSDHYVDNLLSYKKKWSEGLSLMQQLNQAIIWMGERVLDDRRRRMLDSARQAEASNRQHNERGGQAMTQDEWVIDNVRQSGDKAAVSAISYHLLSSFP
jgi:hypothetical protein